MNNSWDEERRIIVAVRTVRSGLMIPRGSIRQSAMDDSKDVNPVWVDDSVYFISDRDGVANVFEYQTKNKNLRR